MVSDMRSDATKSGHSTFSRRQRSEGHISRVRRRRKGGGFTDFWIGRVSAGYDLSGKRRRLSVSGKTKADVLEQMARIRLDPSITRADARNYSLGEFLNQWLTDSIRPNRRPKTLLSYTHTARLHIAPHIGYVKLSKLSPIHVQRLLSILEDHKASPRLRLLTYAILRASLNQAVRWGMISRNPCNAVEPPRAPGPPIRVLDERQVQALLHATRGDRLEALYILALATGMRQGELLGLRWSDIRLESSTLSVNRTLVDLSGHLEVADPKTAKGRRQIDLPRSVVFALREHRKRMLAEEREAASLWVFCDILGGPLRACNVVRRSFRPLLKKAGLPLIRFHDLRHTAATLMLGRGIHPKIVQERLGHAQIAITMDTYTHVLPSMQRDAADKLDRIFSRPDELAN